MGGEYDPRYRSDAFYALLRQLLDSPWKDRPNPGYNPEWSGPYARMKSYGEIFQTLIAAREGLDRRYARGAIDPVTGMPDDTGAPISKEFDMSTGVGGEKLKMENSSTSTSTSGSTSGKNTD